MAAARANGAGTQPMAASSASSEALDVLPHQAICPASYRSICMVIKIASILPSFFVIVDFNHSHNRR
jgi:hypothetical protein